MRKYIVLLFVGLLPFCSIFSIAKSSKEERMRVAERIDSLVHSGNWCILVDRYNRNADLYYDQLTPERNFVSVDNGVLTRCLDLAGARKNSNGSKYARSEESRREQPDYQMRSPIVAGGVQFEKPIVKVKSLVSKDYKHMKIEFLKRMQLY